MIDEKILTFNRFYFSIFYVSRSVMCWLDHLDREHFHGHQMEAKCLTVIRLVVHDNDFETPSWTNNLCIYHGWNEFQF